MKFSHPLPHMFLYLILNVSIVFSDSAFAMEEDDSLELSSGTPQPTERKRLKKKTKPDRSTQNETASTNPSSLVSSLELGFINHEAPTRKRLKKARDVLINGKQEASDDEVDFEENDDYPSSPHDDPQEESSSEDSQSENPKKTPFFPPNLPKKPTVNKITLKQDSDEEQQDDDAYSADFKNFPAAVVDVGLRLKIMANAYLQKVDQTANIFFPHYTLEYIDLERKPQKKSGYFRTPQKPNQSTPSICAFASGGFQNAWEKTVSRVQSQFFGMPIKIIRALWMNKHLPHNHKNLEDEYTGRENELHSELFYDLFFEHFFIPTLDSLANGGKITHLTINAFSWWEVCNTCEERLSKHQDLLPEGVQLTYKIAASRRYYHEYPSCTSIIGFRVPLDREINVRKRIWGKVLECVRKSFPDDEKKREYWTEEFEGLELCKWLGQTFVESEISSTGTMVRLSEREDVLRINKEATTQEIRELTKLITYLRDVNWDLSCWYKPPTFFDEIQKRWRTHWRQVVVPHFDWETVSETAKEGMLDTPDECEMCGCEEVRFPFLIFHPKHKVSRKFLALTPQQRKLRADPDDLFEITSNLPLPLQQKRRQSISVGSTCVQFLQSTREDLDDWRKSHPDEVRDARWERNAKKETDMQDLDKAEKELEKKRKRTSKKKKK